MSWAMKKILSVMISLITLYVPKEYQTRLDNHPSMEKRAEKINLKGWVFNKVVSDASGQEHTWFSMKSEKNDAPTIVLLHGFNTNGSIFFNLKTLSKDYNLIAYNFPDKSAFYKGQLENYNDLIDDFLSDIGLDSVILAGNSVGGSIALKYAGSQTQKRVTHLILLSTNLFGTTEENVKQVNGMADKLLKFPDYKLYYLLIKGREVIDLLEKTRFGEKIPKETIDIKHVDWYRQVLRSLDNYNAQKDAEQVACPVIAFHGSADDMLNVEGAAKYRNLLKTLNFI